MSRVFVAGHKGLVGSAICRRLERDGVEPLVASRTELDLTEQAAVDAFFANNDIAQVYLAAAKVGGSSNPSAISLGVSPWLARRRLWSCTYL